MIIYITRPNAHEIYMGGIRSLMMWVQEPSYSHSSLANELGSETRYVDQGWSAPHSSGVLARYLLKQDEDLLSAVWKEVFTSLCPSGMSYDAGVKWANVVVKPDVEFEITNYHQLSDDREWEAKCNVCNKRFLLEVNLRTCEVKRIPPLVHFRQRTENDPIQREWIRTDQATFLDATEYWHEKPGLDDIPF